MKVPSKMPQISTKLEDANTLVASFYVHCKLAALLLYYEV